MPTTRHTLALALAGAATVLTACTQASTGDVVARQDTSQAAKLISDNAHDRSALQSGGTLTLAIDAMPVNLSAWSAADASADTFRILSATDPRLYDYAPDGTTSADPDFLQSMPTVEQKGGAQVVTYRLNPKARWNDGTPIDWRSFEATWKANRSPVDKGGYDNLTTAGYEDISKVEKGATDHEVVVTFATPFNPVTEVFTSLLHPKVGADPKTFNEAFAGGRAHDEWRAGPFVIAKVDGVAKTVTLARNPRWWGRTPVLDTIVFREMEQSARIPAFRSGELDEVRLATKSRYQQVQGSPDLDIRRGQSLSTQVLVLNTKADPLTDPAVRTALWQAVDRQQWKQMRYQGLAWTEPDVGSNLYFGFQKEYADNVTVKHSVEGARATLAAAGWKQGPDGYAAKGGKRLTIRYTFFGDDPLQTALAQTLQKQVRAAGIDLTLDGRPAAAFGDAMGHADYTVVSMVFETSSVSPITTLCQAYCSSGGASMTFAGDAALDARIRKAGRITDGAAQAREINAIEKAWLGKYHGIMPLANGPMIMGYHKGLANIGPDLFKMLNPHWEDVGWVKGSSRG